MLTGVQPNGSTVHPDLTSKRVWVHAAPTEPLPPDQSAPPPPHREVTPGVQSGKYHPGGYSTDPDILRTHAKAPGSPKTSHQGCRSITAVQPFDPDSQSVGLDQDLPLRPLQHAASWRQPNPTCQSLSKEPLAHSSPVSPLDSFCQQRILVDPTAQMTAFQAPMQLTCYWSRVAKQGAC